MAKKQHFHSKADYDSVWAIRRHTFRDIEKIIKIKYHTARTIGKALSSRYQIDVITTGKNLLSVHLQKISGNPARARFYNFQTGKAVWIPLKDIIGWVFSPDLTKAYVNILKKRSHDAP